MSQTRTLPSRPPDSRFSPVALKSSDVMKGAAPLEADDEAAVWPVVGGARLPTCSPCAMS